MNISHFLVHQVLNSQLKSITVNLLFAEVPPVIQQDELLVKPPERCSRLVNEIVSKRQELRVLHTQKMHLYELLPQVLG